MDIHSFTHTVLQYYAHSRRDFPWRRTNNPYHILVSEIMLQQTQTDRVAPKFKLFVKKFPTAKSLAAAPLGEVLKEWNGLGYNRRAKFLHEAAQVILEEYHGKVPTTVPELRTLPGVGPYIAGAVSAFAYDQPALFIETNIRTALIHHFFPRTKKVSDTKLLSILQRIEPGVSPREWYSALMDYGAFLKRSGVKVNARNPAYRPQSKFEGSDRQIRGAILRLLKEKPRTAKNILGEVAGDQSRTRVQLAKLLREGLVSKRGNALSLG